MSLTSITPAQVDLDKIVLFGDSLTQRGFDPEMQGWAASLANAYIRKLDVINRGFSGFTTEFCLPLLDPILNGYTTKIELFVLFLGTNDSVLKDTNPHQHVPLDVYRSNMKHIITQAQRKCQRVLVITPPPCYEPDWRTHRQKTGREMDRSLVVTKEYRNVCLELCKGLNTPVVDLWNTFLPNGEYEDQVRQLLCDGVHFSAVGNKRVYSAVMDQIKEKWPELDPEGMKSKIAWWDKIDKSDLEGSLVRGSSLQ